MRNISASIIPELDHEMNGVRATLSRVPDDKLGWSPHPKSMTMGRLASHLAEVPSWIVPTVRQTELDLAPKDGPKYEAPSLASREEMLAFFDKNVSAGREALQEIEDEAMMVPWSLLMSGFAIFTMPRIAVLRAFVLSHAIHHRAQLGLYLRMNDIAVPALYGPSADEGGMS